MKNLHFLLRYSDKLSGADTIGEHQFMIEQHGSVWMGKFGVGMSNRFVEIAKKQLERGEPCFLYLMHGAKYTCKANIIDLVAAKTSQGEMSSIQPSITPSYYRKKRCSIWFKLSVIEPMNSDDLQYLWLFNDPASHPCSGGMRGLIYLTYNDAPPPLIIIRLIFNI
ncbi:hypothetical protein ACPSKX_11470 [Moritella viscosa]